MCSLWLWHVLFTQCNRLLSPWHTKRLERNQGAGRGAGTWLLSCGGNIYSNSSFGLQACLSCLLTFWFNLAFLLICEAFLDVDTVHGPPRCSGNLFLRKDIRMTLASRTWMTYSSPPWTLQKVLIKLVGLTSTGWMVLTQNACSAQNSLCKWLLPFSLGPGWCPFCPHQAAVLAVSSDPICIISLHLWMLPELWINTSITEHWDTPALWALLFSQRR